MLYGVDVHGSYQAGISFATLAKQGYSFATIKATQGTGFVAPRFAEWVRLARDAGLIPGLYHWLDSTDGAAQARHFHARVEEAGGPAGLLIQLDCEDDGYGAQMTAWAREWNRLSGAHPFLIYSGAWWWPRTGGFRGADLTPYLWHSRYLTADTDTLPDDPAAFAARIPADWWRVGYGGWTSAAFLQFTSRGDAGGLGNNVDLNATRLTREQLLALTGGDIVTPEEIERIAEVTKQKVVRAMEYSRLRTNALLNGTDPVLLGTAGVEANVLHQRLLELLDRPTVTVDLVALTAAVADALRDPDVLTGIADAVLDEDHRRSAE